MSRIILHSDLNCFYASVEMLLDPSLRGKAVAVCGATEDRHGIVLAKSEAAKKAGIKTGMVNWEAKVQCPELIFVPPQYDQYIKYSKLVRTLYAQYSDCVEPYGMDECWLDLTGSEHLYGDGMAAAEQIRRRVREETGLTVSIGVSFNKIFAKLGSDLKKPDAITQISQQNFRSVIWQLPASDLLYVGRATSVKLARYGIHTIGELARADVAFLRRLLGKNGVELWKSANGLDRSRVMPQGVVSPVKSIGHGITCTADLGTPEDVWRVILELAQDIGHRLRVHEVDATGVQLAVCWSELTWRQQQRVLEHPTRSPMEIAEAAFELFRPMYQADRPVRAVTVRAYRLNPHGQPDQIDLFDDYQRRERREQIDDAVDDIRRRYGKNVIRSASLLGDLKMPNDGRDEVVMPGVMYR